MHDGPGVRTVVFFKGCPLKCLWCHNPETQKTNRQIMFIEKKCIKCGACVNICPNKAQTINPRNISRDLCISCAKCVEICQNEALSISGKEVSIEDIINDIKKDIPFYLNNGGVTISGGEPTLQKDALIEILKEAKQLGISTCIETCGVFNESLVDELLPLVDTYLIDVKDTDEDRLYKNTGASLSHLLKILHLLDDKKAKITLRCILIPEINLNEKHLIKLTKIYKSLNNVECIELLPYHPYGLSKSEQLGLKDSSIAYTKPEREEVLDFANKLKNNNVKVKCFGSEI